MKVKKKMNEKKWKDIIDMLVIHVPLRSYSIDVPRVQTVFLEDCKKKISISHILKKNWNFKFLVV